MSTNWGAWTIVTQGKVDQQYDDALLKYERFNEAYDALIWLLARKPTIGLCNEYDGVEYWIHVQDGDSIARTPAIWVLYRLNHQEVILENINVVPYE